MNELLINLYLANLALIVLFGVFRFIQLFEHNPVTVRRLLMLIPVFALIPAFVSLPAPAGTQSTPVMQYVYNIVVYPGETTVSAFNTAAYLPDILLAVYTAGSIMVIMLTAVKFRRISRLLRKFPREKRAGYVLINTNTLPVFSFFHYLFWNPGEIRNADEEKWIFRHEMAHIRGKHTADVVFLSLLRIIFWPNPVYYLFEQEARLNHEYLADKAAMSEGDNPKLYGLCLLQKSLNTPDVLLFNYFNQSQLKKRIKMVTTGNMKNGSGWLHLITLPLTACLLTGLFAFTNGTTGFSGDADPENQERIIDDMEKLDEQPVFPGGHEALIAFLRDEVEYPEAARDEKLEGRVIVSILISEEGKVTAEIRENGSLHPLLDEAALNAAKNMPDWQPGKINGNPVPVRIYLPVTFRLSENE